MQNKDLVIIEESTDSSGLSESEPIQRKIDMRSPITINDCNSESDDISNKVTPKSDSAVLSVAKVMEIQKWVKQVTHCNSNEISLFSEVSSISGDSTKSYPEGSSRGVNSTETETCTKRFDELFKRDGHRNTYTTRNNKEDTKLLVLEDSFEVNEKHLGNDKNIDQESTIELVLDSLYGDSWRCAENNVLLKSEPRKVCNWKKMELHNVRNVNSERKPNKYLNANHYIRDGPDLKPEESLMNDYKHDHKSVNSYTHCISRIKLNFTGKSDQPPLEHLTDNSAKNHETCTEKDNNFNILTEPLEQRVKKNIKQKKTIKDVEIDRDERKGEARNGPKNKTKKSLETRFLSDIASVSSDEEWNKEITQIHKAAKEGKCVVHKYSFLSSLSKSIPDDKCNPSAKILRDNYKLYRDKLTLQLFELFNINIFSSELSSDVATLEWSHRLRGTAGYCVCRKVTKRSGSVQRIARIVLSVKVLDSADRLRDTLLHELCHAATWIINGISDGHGSFWKTWASKAMRTFPELPPIKRCHDYVINTKYTYKCTECGYSIGRHTKSLDIERKRCGHCYGKFEIFINKISKKGEAKAVPVTPRKEATGFALFVKENYSVYKNPSRGHGDVMKILGQKFTDLKLKPI